LERFGENDPELNGFLVSYLVDLGAVESISCIQAAFEKECVDFSIIGDLEDVEIHLGLREERSTPADYPTIFDEFRAPPPFWGAGSTYVREEPKVGRNDPCPCGSGKKYKKCCLNKRTEQQHLSVPSSDRIELPSSVREEIARLVKQGRKIEAVQRIVHLTDAGLRAAKDYVDRLM